MATGSVGLKASIEQWATRSKVDLDRMTLGQANAAARALSQPGALVSVDQVTVEVLKDHPSAFTAKARRP